MPRPVVRHDPVVRHLATLGSSSQQGVCNTLFALFLLTFAIACSNQTPATPPEAEPETLARTEFTKRVESFFEYAPLRAGQPSQFLIHLTDLQDGTPVEGADVVLTARLSGSDREIAQAKARIGKVTGIYVAELAVPQAGKHDVEFHIKNSKLDERMVSSDFQVN